MNIPKLTSLIHACSLIFIANYALALDVELLYAGPEDLALKGVRQGIDEANLQGQFLNQRYMLKTIAADEIDATRLTPYSAIFSNVDSDTFLQLLQRRPDTGIFNLNLDDDSLRNACIRNALHILPSQRMKRDALNQWWQKQPAAAAAARAWHPNFKKFAARDLNKRFLKQHDVPMEDLAWAGWAATKITSDTVARISTNNAAALLNFFKTELAFDGQKGNKMRFRETGQLRQPVLIVNAETILAEAPVRGIARPPTLDSLGIVNCEK